MQQSIWVDPYDRNAFLGGVSVRVLRAGRGLNFICDVEEIEMSLERVYWSFFRIPMVRRKVLLNFGGVSK